jgi:hypothetical protein
MKKFSFDKDMPDCSEIKAGIIKFRGVSCTIEFEDDGEMRLVGPAAVQEEMIAFAAAHAILRAVSKVIGTDVNFLQPEILDGMLAGHHAELAVLVPDGADLDVGPERTPAVLQQLDGFIEQASRELGDAAMLAGIKRSVIMRRHAIVAKLEERRQRLSLN